MPILQADPATRIDLDDVVKVAFEKDASSPLGQRADLLVACGSKLALAASGKVDKIARDITERKRAEELLAKRVDEQAALYQLTTGCFAPSRC